MFSRPKAELSSRESNQATCSLEGSLVVLLFTTGRIKGIRLLTNAKHVLEPDSIRCARDELHDMNHCSYGCNCTCTVGRESAHMTNWKWQRTCHGPASEAEPVNGNKLQAEARAGGRGSSRGH